MQESNKVKITFPIDFRWFPTVLSALHMYMYENEFSERLMQMVCMAADNVLGRLYVFALEAQTEKDCQHEATMSMDFSDGNLAIDVTYGRTLHFDPIGDISLDKAERNSEKMTVDLGALQYNDWLVRVQALMDRVVSRTEGSVRTLHMEKFRREDGKERQMWIFSLTPRLKPGLYIDESNIEGSPYAGYLHDFRTDRVLRLGRRELDIVKRIDGRTSLFDIYIGFATEGDGPVGPQVFEALYRQLESSGMIDGGQERRHNIAARAMHSLRNMTFVLPHSDRLAGWFYHALRPMFTTGGVAFVLVFALTALYPLYAQYGEFRQMFVQSLGIVRANPMLGVWSALLFFVSIVLHEFSHAAVVKKYGGHVPRIGITYYICMVIFFCDTTCSGNFPKKKQRIMVSLGGPLCSLLIWAAAVWTFALATDLHVRAVAFGLYFSLGLSIVLNFNPLLRMDSYYMLSDLVGIDGLRSRSFNFLKDGIRSLLGIRTYKHHYTRRQKWCLSIYGVLGAAVTFFFCLRPFIRILRLTDSGFTPTMRTLWIVAMALVGVVNVGNMVSRNVRSLTHRSYKIK